MARNECVLIFRITFETKNTVLKAESKLYIRHGFHRIAYLFLNVWIG